MNIKQLKEKYELYCQNCLEDEYEPIDPFDFISEELGLWREIYSKKMDGHKTSKIKPTGVIMETEWVRTEDENPPASTTRGYSEEVEASFEKVIIKGHFGFDEDGEPSCFFNETGDQVLFIPTLWRPIKKKNRKGVRWIAL